MHFLVFDRTPQSFDENVVHETTASVHRNRDARSLKLAGEGGAGELRALIGVEYFRFAVPRQCFVERRDAKARIHRVRQAPRQNCPGGEDRSPADTVHSKTSYSNATPSGSFSFSHVSAASAFANTLR